MFSQACVKNSVHGVGGVYPKERWNAPPGQTFPSADTLLGRHSTGQTPPWADNIWADTPRQTPPTRTTGNRQQADGTHILLECILVFFITCKHVFIQSRFPTKHKLEISLLAMITNSEVQSSAILFCS